jgi:hypothetical protein
MEVKFKKKPIVIEAFRYAVDPEPVWFRNKVRRGSIVVTDKHCLIPTLEGLMISLPGVYIIQGPQGEIYPCQPDIFEATYDKLESPL